MKFKIYLDKVSGSPDSNGWTICADFLPISGDLVAKKGHLFVVASMLPKNSAQLSISQNKVVGEEILRRIKEEYLDKSGNEFNLLSQTVEKVKTIFTSPNESLQILVASVIGSKIILAGGGTVEAWVLRNGQLAKIIKGEEALSSSSGILNDKDIFFLGTSGFFNSVTPDLLKSETGFASNAKESKIGAMRLKMEEIPGPAPVVSNIQTLNNKTLPPVAKISPVRIFAAKLIDKILSVIPEKRNFVREEFTNPGSGGKKRYATKGGLVLLILLLIGIFIGMNRKKQGDLKSQYQPILASINRQLSDAESLASVNNTRSRELILTARNQIEPLLAQNIKDPQINSLNEKIKNDMITIAGIYQQDANKFLDLTLLNNSINVNEVAGDDERMLVLDSSGKRLYSIEIGSSHEEPVQIPDVISVTQKVAIYSGRNFVAGNDGIWEVGDKASSVIKKDWGNDYFIKAYTGNIYLLDKSNSKIWKYNGDAGVFSTKVNWFGPGTNPDLSNVASWAIDGNIWILTNNYKILKFQAGSPVNFSLQNMDKDPKETDIFTSQDSKYLYLLDPSNSRVLVVDKDGNYKAQYVGNNIKEASRIIVSESAKKIILVEGNKLFSLDIKHL